MIEGFFIYMIELNLFNEGIKVMSSREIAILTNKNHSDVMRDIRNMLEQLGFNQNANLRFDNSGAKGRKVNYYNLPKRECLILASGYNINLRAAIIDRWIELETKERNENLPQNYLSALKALVASEEKKQLAESRVKEMQPKAESYDQFIDSKSLQGFKEVANLLSMGRNKLMAQLREKKILTKRNIPYQEYLGRGYFEVKESTQSGFNVATTYVTPKGINYIRKKL